MNQAYSLINNVTSNLCNIEKSICLETTWNFMKLLYQDSEKIENKVSNLVELHDNIIMVLIAFFTLLVTLFGILRG
jgi:hypothetical protein